jgi:hypothetical protein
MNVIEEGRYALAVNVGYLAIAEFSDSTALWGITLRVIRNGQGYYFITGPRFKHVYVFRTGEGSLVSTSRIAVSTTGLTSPAFNQRAPYEMMDNSLTMRQFYRRRTVLAFDSALVLYLILLGHDLVQQFGFCQEDFEATAALACPNVYHHRAVGLAQERY